MISCVLFVFISFNRMLLFPQKSTFFNHDIVYIPNDERVDCHDDLTPEILHPTQVLSQTFFHGHSYQTRRLSFGTKPNVYHVRKYPYNIRYNHPSILRLSHAESDVNSGMDERFSNLILYQRRFEMASFSEEAKLRSHIVNKIKDQMKEDKVWTLYQQLHPMLEGQIPGDITNSGSCSDLIQKYMNQYQLLIYLQTIHKCIKDVSLETLGGMQLCLPKSILHKPVSLDQSFINHQICSSISLLNTISPDIIPSGLNIKKPSLLAGGLLEFENWDWLRENP